MQGEGFQSQKCLQNLALDRKLATSLSLRWEYLCLNISLSAYKIYYKHDDWLACPDKKTESRNFQQKSGLFVVSNETRTVILSPLHPYSKYEVTIKAISSNSIEIASEYNRINRMEISGFFNTSQFFPSIKPELLTGNDVNEDNDTILFTWCPPSFLKCDHFNGKIIGYQYIFKFTDGCNLEKEETGGTGDPVFEFYKDSAIINYTLYIYAENELGMINTKLPLIINGSSNSIATIRKYYTPKNMVVQINNTGLTVCWNSLCDVGMSYLIRIVIDEEMFCISPNHIEDMRIYDEEFTISYKYCIVLEDRNETLYYHGNLTSAGIKDITLKNFHEVTVEVVIKRYSCFSILHEVLFYILKND